MAEGAPGKIDLSLGDGLTEPEREKQREESLQKTIEDAEKRAADREARGVLDPAAYGHVRSELAGVLNALAGTRHGAQPSKAALEQIAEASLDLTGVSTAAKTALQDAAKAIVAEYVQSGNLAAAGEVARQHAVAIASSGDYSIEPKADTRSVAEVVESIAR
jgi:hypothetical protein